MIRIATLTTSALIVLTLIAGPASAQQKGGVQIAGNATVIVVLPTTPSTPLPASWRRPTRTSAPSRAT